MALYYCSIADNHTGKFLGACFVNAEDVGAVPAAVGEVLKGANRPETCVEIASCPVPAGGPSIPAIGRLFSRAELEAWTPQIAMVSDGGTLRRA